VQVLRHDLLIGLRVSQCGESLDDAGEAQSEVFDGLAVTERD